MLTAAGLEMSTEQCRLRFQGMLLSEIAASAAQQLGGAFPTAFLERYQRDGDMAFRERLRPVRGAAASVRRIKRAGIRVCEASQGQLTKTELTLGLTGLRRLFDQDALFSAYSVPRGKPFPDLFLKAAER
jgi:beta-phosphoglucomutase-like phosphatase (HAD superfamily)